MKPGITRNRILIQRLRDRREWRCPAHGHRYLYPELGLGVLIRRQRLRRHR